MPFKIRMLPVLVAVLTLAACTGVENLAGVELATVAIEPTPTPAPTATPDPAAVALANSTTKEFLGTTIVLSYPEGWERDEGGQSLNIFDAGSEVDTPPGIGLFISLLRSIGIEDPSGPVAAEAMHLFLARAVEGGWVNENSAPDSDEALAFTWGEHDAAMFMWSDPEAELSGVNITVIDSKARRMVLVGAQSSTSVWEDFMPTWQAVLGTFVLDGTPLPLADLSAALADITR